MSNTGSDRLVNTSKMQMEILMYVPNVTDVSARTEVFNQHLRSCYLKNKITDVQTPYERKEDKANDQTYISTLSLRYKWGNYKDYLFERNLSLAY